MYWKSGVWWFHQPLIRGLIFPDCPKKAISNLALENVEKHYKLMLYLQQDQAPSGAEPTSNTMRSRLFPFPGSGSRRSSPRRFAFLYASILSNRSMKVFLSSFRSKHLTGPYPRGRLCKPAIAIMHVPTHALATHTLLPSTELCQTHPITLSATACGCV